MAEYEHAVELVSEIERLLESVKALPSMTPEQIEAQRRSFAYGNLKFDHPEVTREDIDRAAESLKMMDN